MRSFNTAGPVNPTDHYLIAPLEAGHLVAIDRRENRSWEEKVFHLRRDGGAVPVDVWGM